MPIATILSLITASTLALVHIIALELYLYWQVWWLDIVTHFIGGMLITLLWFWLYELGVFSRRTWLRARVTLPIVLLVALLWEVFELAIGRPVLADFWSDTTIDILAGMFGGTIAFVFMNKILQLGVWQR